MESEVLLPYNVSSTSATAHTGGGVSAPCQPSYVLISPVYNEESFIGRMIESIAAQIVIPEAERPDTRSRVQANTTEATIAAASFSGLIKRAEMPVLAERQDRPNATSLRNDGRSEITKMRTANFSGAND